MDIECPRCLLTNSESVLVCECGFDLMTYQQRRRNVASEPSPVSRPMRIRSFVIGLLLVWGVLCTGEWYRVRAALPRGSVQDLTVGSALVGLTDLAGALLIGAVGWVCARIGLSRDDQPVRLCARRTTFVVTALTAGMLYLARAFDSDLPVEQRTLALVFPAIALVSYYGGGRGWLGKWWQR